jgi:hypothetical protein
MLDDDGDIQKCQESHRNPLHLKRFWSARRHWEGPMEISSQMEAGPPPVSRCDLALFRSWYAMVWTLFFYIRFHIPIISNIPQPFSTHASRIYLRYIPNKKPCLQWQVARMPWLAQFLGWHITRWWHKSQLWWYDANPLFLDKKVNLYWNLV